MPSSGLQGQPRDEDRGYEYAGKPPPPSPDKPRGSHERKSRKASSQERRRGSEKGRRRKSSVTPQRSSSSSAREIPVSIYMALQEKASFNLCGVLSCVFLFVVIAGVMAFFLYAFVLDGFAQKDGDNSTVSSPIEGASADSGAILTSPSVRDNGDHNGEDDER
ncbi:hypothetical protein ANCCAN_09213 [Ancylostoma caninum]|uniref:Transmembrane protein n=1 Tax=Ancylostoma caninum TaxID=29170 RepID=A0A368GK97_ANCCA|nr:hypothetical protein ANCCAN_09213 [Ancylostoma caninum]